MFLKKIHRLQPYRPCLGHNVASQYPIIGLHQLPTTVGRKTGMNAVVLAKPYIHRKDEDWSNQKIKQGDR